MFGAPKSGNACSEDDLLLQPVRNAVTQFFDSENIALPRGQTWRNVSANIFQVVDGKKLLFENEHALFAKLRSGDPPVSVIRESIAGATHADELHEDIHGFFKRLSKAVAALAG